MANKNLHSLINRPWYIEKSFAQAHLPLLNTILDGKMGDFINEDEEKDDPFILSTDHQSKKPGATARNVVVFPIKSAIYKYDQFCGPMGTKSMIAYLEEFENDSSIAGIVLDVDSGGGQVSGTPEFYDFLKNYSKPIVAYTDGYMCSAAYYLSAATNEIIANKRAEHIGSIGAYTMILDLNGYYEKMGAKLHTIYATRSTEKNKGYNDALEGNYETYIKEQLDPIVDDFIQDMKAARPSLDEAVFKGATYNANKSLNMGLIDSIGSLRDAIDRVFSLAKDDPETKNFMNTTERPNLQAALELDAPIAATENGSYLNDEQLDALETHLTDDQQTITDLQATNEDLTNQIETAQQNAAAVNDVLYTLATAAGLELEEGLEDEDLISQLSDRITELSKTPAVTHTIINKKEEPEAKHAYIDFNSPIYKSN